MSTMERNKGRLIPQYIDTELFDDEAFESYSENGFVVIDREIYSVDWDVKSEQDCTDFAEVGVDELGVIHFHTLHYNGGANWTEVVEWGLNGNR